MKRLPLLVALLFACLLPLASQNNPYELNDECFRWFSEADALVGKEGFDKANEQLLRVAISNGDTKAQTLYYVGRLKNLTNSLYKKQTTKADDERVLKAMEELKEISSRLGYRQYFYYAYELVQTYFYNHKKPLRTMELVQEMQQISLERGEDYGLWMSSRYMVSLYIAQNDYITAKKYILKSLRIYDESDDPVVRRQSLCRLYCDLADTYLIGADSLKINLEKAVRTSKVHLDTLRCEYHLAKLAAYEKDVDAYHRHRDYCLADPLLHSISSTAALLFETLDSIIEGHFNYEHVQSLNFSRIREVKYIANVAEVYGYKDQAFDIERIMVRKYETLFAESNQTKLAEMDARLNNDVLSADLAHKSRELKNTTTYLFILVLLVLVTAMVLLVVQIRSLRRRKERDGQLIAELRDANEKVKLADAAKTRFVQNMSHEVRTPLNAIVGFSQLLSLPDGSFSPEEKDEFSGHIINNSKMLTMLLDDILNTSAMDSGNYNIQIEDGECGFMCRAAITSAEHRLQPGVTMEYVSQLPEPYVIRTDPRRVQQILINLLTNACKHTTKGEIKLTCSLDEAAGEVSFAVTDTGSGIPADQAERIFERFTKLDQFVQGTGLGLSICRDIASRMGARVYLDTSYTEGGSRFVFTVPVNNQPQS